MDTFQARGAMAGMSDLHASVLAEGVTVSAAAQLEGGLREERDAQESTSSVRVSRVAATVVRIFTLSQPKCAVWKTACYVWH
jgi:hypothetical protein